jgi:hypothetical protein
MYFTLQQGQKRDMDTAKRIWHAAHRIDRPYMNEIQAFHMAKLASQTAEDTLNTWHAQSHWPVLAHNSLRQKLLPLGFRILQSKLRVESKSSMEAVFRQQRYRALPQKKAAVFLPDRFLQS